MSDGSDMSLESESYKKSQVHQDLWIFDDFPDVTLVCDDPRQLPACLVCPPARTTHPCGGGGCRGPTRAPEGPPRAPRRPPKCPQAP